MQTLTFSDLQLLYITFCNQLFIFTWTRPNFLLSKILPPPRNWMIAPLVVRSDYIKDWACKLFDMDVQGQKNLCLALPEAFEYDAVTQTCQPSIPISARAFRVEGHSPDLPISTLQRSGFQAKPAVRAEDAATIPPLSLILFLPIPLVFPPAFSRLHTTGPPTCQMHAINHKASWFEICQLQWNAKRLCQWLS